jgi:1,4-dihydroxy-2-naphthoate octaprenyltransferase
VLALVLFVVGVIASACAAGTLDDLQGARDGLDRQTYADDDELRGVVGKPLITGEISEQAAYRFALVSGALGTALGVLAAVVAPHGPWWMVFAWPVAGYLATQYSWGIKLSYHGMGELLLGVEAIAIMLIPLVFLTGSVSDTGLFEALLLGSLFAQVTVFSSSQDAEIDRAFNRMTMAARLSPAANRRFIATVFAAGWAVTAAGFATGALEPWLLLALAPVWALQVAQLRQGLGLRRWLVARHLGWRAFDAGFVALVVVNLLTA